MTDIPDNMQSGKLLRILGIMWMNLLDGCSIILLLLKVKILVISGEEDSFYGGKSPMPPIDKEVI